jgi:hypothetical protein
MELPAGATSPEHQEGTVTVTEERDALRKALKRLLDASKGIPMSAGTAEMMNYMNRYREARENARQVLDSVTR